MKYIFFSNVLNKYEPDRKELIDIILTSCPNFNSLNVVKKLEWICNCLRDSASGDVQHNSCDIPPRVWGREASHQGKEEKNRQTKINKENKNLSAVFTQEHTQIGVYVNLELPLTICR
jgi:hypothetical protein